MDTPNGYTDAPQKETVMSDADYPDGFEYDTDAWPVGMCIYPDHQDGSCVCERKLGY
jgi:hypothetical protein